MVRSDHEIQLILLGKCSLVIIDITYIQLKLSLRSRNSGEINGVDHGDLDKLKNEILSELRKEIQKAKAEIIEGELRLFQLYS